MVELDSCRADKIGVTGYARPVTPRLDRLATDADGVAYRWHFVQAPHTKASTASLFTGLYPFQHGVFIVDLLAELELRAGRYGSVALPQSVPTLAERFQAGGFRTFAAVAIGHLSERDGYSRGFDTYLPAARDAADRNLLAAAVEFLAADERPAFAYVHVRACHNPIPRERRDLGYVARFAPDFDESRDMPPGLDLSDASFKTAIRRRQASLDARQVEFLHVAYEAVFRRVDEELVGETVERLRALGLYDRTTLVFTADHGEELYDHGGYAHGHAVWNELIRVPLIVKFARGQRPRLPPIVDTVSQSIDFFPSILRFYDIDPGARSSAHGLFDAHRRGSLVRSDAPGSWAVVDFPWKVVVPSRGRPLLFDLVADPRESRDLARDHPDVASRLLASGRALEQLPPHFGPRSRTAAGQVSEEELENLRSLGYLN